MKINLQDLDLSNFLCHPHKLKSGETVYLVQPQHIGCKWTKHNLIFRSSVWNADGEPVSLSFKKFFNFSEQPELDYTPFSLTANGGTNLIEKVDGSTLIVSKYKGEFIVRTRGTVDARLQENGFEVEYLLEKYPTILATPDDDTWDHSLLFEWVSPTNQIVIRYGDEPDLYLTGLVNHSDYSYASQSDLDDIAKTHGWKRPQRFDFGKVSVKEMLNVVETMKGKEGLCLYCNRDQSIRKVKSAWYLSLHRAKTEFNSFERVVDVYFENKFASYDEFYNFVASQFDFEIAEMARPQISKIIDGMKQVREIVAGMRVFIDKRNLRGISRKDAAQQILQAYGNTNRSGMVFRLLDGKELTNDELKKLLYQTQK